MKICVILQYIGMHNGGSSKDLIMVREQPKPTIFLLQKIFLPSKVDISWELPYCRSYIIYPIFCDYHCWY